MLVITKEVHLIDRITWWFTSGRHCSFAFLIPFRGRLTRHWDLTAKEKLTTMRTSLELEGINLIECTGKGNPGSCLHSVRDHLSANLSGSFVIGDQKSGNRTVLVGGIHIFTAFNELLWDCGRWCTYIYGRAYLDIKNRCAQTHP